ncbi:EAL domain-containing protein [Trinickia sp. LjRoot230]|uniref:putative bifunctional diguanylate cyclase/phosphodiesterase n=1 Tax=Trinickia sp. LjRoot230 TaxID=3342288 RepID=UPI003ED109C7
MYVGTYSAWLVVLSLLVAILASYTALDMGGRVAAGQGRSVHGWLIAGAFAMGVGIWSMHFIGMLAFSLPIKVGYDPTLTFLSLLIAVISSAIALWLISQPALPRFRLVCGAMLMGMGIAGMHYMGMAAMLMAPAIQYAASWFLLSIAIAVLASGAALWIAFRLRHHSPRVRLLRTGAAVVMGFAIVGMHYTGMAAARFPLGSVCEAARTGVNAEWLANLIIVGTVAIMAIALTFSILDRRLQARTAALAASLARAEELAYLALHDNLTKLPNRALLEQRLERAIRNAVRDNRQIAVIFVDLDGFKAINDALGHHVGDLLLVDVARRICASVGAEETVARMGGDEFVLLVNIGEAADAAIVAEHILTSLNKQIEIEGHELRVSASLGIAVYPGSGEHSHELLINADAAMYRTKALGRNGYCFYDVSMNVNAHAHLQLLQDLRLALEQDELVLHYQPKFKVPHGPVVGVEALVRWAHPTAGLIPPDQFIPLAEKAGLIVPIGEWVLNEACRQMAQWRDAGCTSWSVAVNLSVMQFRHSTLVQTVRAALESHALEPHQLTLEVTESTAMGDVEASMIILQQLHEMGVQIAIDDFGTGYSSLLYLKRLPADELKIDRGFVRDLMASTEDIAIVSAIVALGKTLNLRVVAEGVETLEQQAFLSRVGCDALQGFLLGRPMPASQVTEALVLHTSPTERQREFAGQTRELHLDDFVTSAESGMRARSAARLGRLEG